MGTLQTLAQQSFQTAAQQAFPELTTETLESLHWERPKNPEFGDYAVNVSSLAKTLKKAPSLIAEAISAALNKVQESNDITANPVGGFINVSFSQTTLNAALLNVLTTEQPGQNTTMANERILLEYVSANPTGPLHIGHGRWAALGNALQRIWEYCGATVWAEFYINDAGVQMQNITLALAMRIVEVFDTQNKLPKKLDWSDVAFPYPGEYVRTLAEDYLSQADHARTMLEVLQSTWTKLSSANELSPEALARQFLSTELQGFARTTLLEQQKVLLSQLGVTFDRWFAEKTELHTPGFSHRYPSETRRHCIQKRGCHLVCSQPLWRRKRSSLGQV